ncbi:MAG: exodeoxyribonuclease V subunit gamma [Candidatus Scalindua sp.]|nr:exodeoxyribonuclease V subunit gamma [Candidatus Scalindua sp.]
MKERFLVLGSAGSGKTHLVIQKFLQCAKEHKEENVIFVLPNHSQVKHLRDHILRTSAIRGYFDSCLITFSGLTEKIIDNLPLQESVKRDTEDTVPQSRNPINENEKDMILSMLFKDIETSYFTRVLDFPGFKRAFLNFVREIKENSLDPHSFKANLRTGKTNRNVSPYDLKFNELARLYTSYQEALNRKGFMDQEDFLAQAIQHINDETLSHIKLLLIDGFHDYTQLEFTLLEELSSRIPNVYITLPYNTSGYPSPVFLTAQKTYSRLEKLGLRKIELKENKRARCQVLKHIEANIFSNTIVPPISLSSQETATFQIIEAASIQDEIEQIARRIRKLTDKNRYGFSEIAVIFRNVEKYQDIAEDIFQRFCIPVRIYGRRSLIKNPLIKAIVNTTKVYTENWADNSVWDILKSYSGIERDLLHALESEHLSKGNINDCNGWLELTSRFKFKPIHRFLRRMKIILSNLEGRHPFSTYCKCYIDIADLFYKSAFTPFNTFTDEVNGKILVCNQNQEISELMKSDASALGEFLAILNNSTFRKLYQETRVLTFEEFNHILISQLTLASYGKRDRRMNVVNVINVVEARQWEMPVVFVGGLLEKEFPRQVGEDLFLKDFQRKRLNSTGKAALREMPEQMDEERYLFYIAITRANERLYLSYPSTNSDGNSTLPSFFLSDLKKLFPEEIKEKISIKRSLSKIIPEPEEIITSTDLKSFVYYHFTIPYTTSHEQYEKDVALWLYNNMENETSFRKELSLLRKLVDSYENLKLNLSDKRIIKKIRETAARFNATKLRDFAQCPYKYFGGFTLNLKQASPLTLDFLVQGRIIHQVLEEYIKGNQKMNISTLFEDSFQQATRGMVVGFEELKIKNDMLKALVTFGSKERESLLSPFKPAMLEEKFGDENNKPIEIFDATAGRIEISGKIDRVDVSLVNGEKIGIIIDYKYGKTEFDVKEMEEGTDLQLPIYALALRDVFNIVPVAAEYYALKSSKKTGIYNQDLTERLGLNLELTKKSLAADNREFTKRLEETKNRILQFAKEIHNGRIELAPHNLDRCGERNCDFANVCRIDKWKLR